MATMGYQRPMGGKLLGKLWVMKLQGNKCLTNLNTVLYSHVYCNKIVTYWASNGWINKEMDSLIDWEGHRTATKALKNLQIWLAKNSQGEQDPALKCASGNNETQANAIVAMKRKQQYT